MWRVTAAALVGLLAAGAALAGQVAATPPSGSTAASKADDPPAKMVCKRVPVIGSNVGSERVCTPRADGQKTANEPRDASNNAQRHKGSTGE